MAELYKPKQSSSGGFLGIQEIGIVDVEDKSNQFDWADLFLEITIRSKNSQYNDKLNIFGEFKRDEDNHLTVSPLLKRIYGFIDGVGLSCGIDINGEWAEESGEKIPNITNYLYKRLCFVDDDGKPEKYPYLAYLYKEWKKKPGKAFTTVHSHLFPNTAEGRTQLTERINYLKQKGYLKEYVERSSSQSINLPSDPDLF